MLRLDRRALAVPFLFMSLSLPALADEPKGCDGFKWPLQTEASLLQSATKPVVLSGTTAVIDGKAFTLQLLDAGSAGLPKPPERAPRATPSMAGFAGFGPPGRGLLPNHPLRCRLDRHRSRWQIRQTFRVFRRH